MPGRRPPRALNGTGEAIAVFLASRAVLWAVAAVTVTGFGAHLNPERERWDDPILHDAADWIGVWARWDSYWFLRIAEQGYAWPSSTPAFFPLTPLAIRAVSTVLGGSLVVAGVVVSLVAGTLAFVALHRLAERVAGRAAARAAVAALAIFPTSLFLGAVYSESLFLALAVWSFLLAERGRPAAASVLAGLAIVTRAQGLALLPAIALHAWARGRGRAAVAAVVPAIAIAAAVPLTLWVSIGRPFAFLRGQDVWERRLSPLGPIGGIASAVGDADLFELGFAVVMVTLAIVAWRRLGRAYGAYALLALAIPMSLPSDRLGGLYSFPRLALAAFPCFIALGLVLERRRVLAAAYGVAAATLLLYSVVRWSLWHWVA